MYSRIHIFVFATLYSRYVSYLSLGVFVPALVNVALPTCMCFSLKVQQGLLVDFGAFPQKFIALLSLCLQEEQKDVPKFIVHLVTNGNSDCSTASLNVIETNPFKHLTHLSLMFLPGMDADVKEYLADCLKTLKVCVLGHIQYHVSTSPSPSAMDMRSPILLLNNITINGCYNPNTFSYLSYYQL